MHGQTDIKFVIHHVFSILGHNSIFAFKMY